MRKESRILAGCLKAAGWICILSSMGFLMGSFMLADDLRIIFGGQGPKALTLFFLALAGFSGVGFLIGLGLLAWARTLGLLMEIKEVLILVGKRLA